MFVHTLSHLVRRLLLLGCALSFSTVVNVRATLVYVDAADGSYHTNHASPNTYNLTDDSATSWVTSGGDGTPQWRFRNSGPAAVSYGLSSYQGKYSEGDPSLYTKVTGLTPGNSYSGLRLYFVVSANNTTSLIEYSLDGSTWSGPINRTTAGVVYLVDSTSDPLGTVETGAIASDTRCYYPIPGSLTANASGEIVLYVRSPSGASRTDYDGLAFEDGYVPPSSQATNPRPANGGKVFGAGSVSTLSWSNPPPTGALTCNVYFGSAGVYDPSNSNHGGLPLIGTVSGESISMPSITNGSKYYWIVDCVDSVAGTQAGSVWSFDVVPPSAATGLIITEFMASNTSTVTNGAAGTADWIEIYNNSASTIDLTGWHLTDNSNNLAKWTFPSVQLPADSFLLVWADDLNAVISGEIHASFKLGAEGEYLALVQPDGTTIQHEYAPKFPNQANDISYGVDLLANGADITLAPSQAACRLLVPAADAGTTWHDRVYDDSGWQSGVTGVGYKVSGTAYDQFVNTDVGSVMYNQMASVYLRIPFRVDDPELLTSLRLTMYFEDGFVAYINGVKVASSNAPASPAWNAAATAARGEGEALTACIFQLTNQPSSLLVSGTNVLVIHGLNVSTASTNLLIQPSLEATLTNGVTVLQERYYSEPTPGTYNSTSFEGAVADTKFSVDRGFYSSSFSVAITCGTAGSSIRYTLDGSTPTPVNGTLYTGPITVSTTTIIRAVAYKTGWKSSDVDTQTYIFPADVVNQPASPAGWPTSWAGTVTASPATFSDYEMDPEIVGDSTYTTAVRSGLTNIPTLSIVTDLENLFDPDTGIYSNPREEGALWERPASAELIYPDGTKGFQENCGLRIQGAGSRGPTSTPKHSLRLVFKSIYGASKLNFKVFPDTDVDSYNSIHLRAIYNLSWCHSVAGQREAAQENHDQFARDLQLAMGQETVRGFVCHLYVNGLYWGLYHPGERPDASFAASHLGGSEEDWDVLNHGEVSDGNRDAWDAMWALTNGLSNLSTYTNFMQYCDVEALADYMIINHYVGNLDWDNVNWYAIRKREPGAGYKFICWDTENSMMNVDDNRITGAQNNANGPTTLFLRATASPEFRLLLADRIHKHFFNGGVCTPTRAANIWRQRSDVIDTVIAAESARWGDFRRDVIASGSVVYKPNTHYYPWQSYLFGTYFPVRTANVLAQYAAQGLYPTLAAPELSVHGGFFSNSITVTISGSGTIYYTRDGTDPRQFGTGTAVGTVYSGAITLTNSTRIKARSYSGGTWSALTEADFHDLSPSPLRVSEVMYAPRQPSGTELTVNSNAQAYAFVEIQNTGTKAVGLVGVSIIDGVKFDFSKGSVLSLAPGEYVVAVEDRKAFVARYPSVSTAKIAGEFRGDLSKSGESVKVSVLGVGDVASFAYSDGRGWPLAADGAGHSLIPLVLDDQSSGQLSYGGNWKASVNVDGSPGSAEPSPIAALALNEIAAHTDYSDPAHPEYDSDDWIELINYGGTTVSLDGYYLSDDPLDLKKWAIPSGTNLAAGQRIVFDEVTGFHSPITNGFGIDKAGEQVLLSYAAGSGPASVVDAIAFKGQENGRTLGRYPDATGYWVACQLTPGSANVPVGQEPVISEIMYHPPSVTPGIDNTEHEFVEIHNPTAQSVNLWTTDDAVNVGPWRLSGQVEYTFPDSTVLPAGGRVLVVPFDPVNDITAKAAFLLHYGLSSSVTLYGPFDGNLSNQGGRLALERPQLGDLPGEGVSWVVVDEVYYFDESPWMADADGLGASLQRTTVSGAGRDPASWSSATPTPASDQAEIRLSISQVSGQLKLGFNLPAGFSYALEMCTNLSLGEWTTYATVTNGMTNYDVNLIGSSKAMFFRLHRQ